MLTRKPRKGDKIRWDNWKPGRVGIVVSVVDNLCYVEEPSDRIAPFIWFFPSDVGKDNECGRNEGRNTLAEIIDA